MSSDGGKDTKKQNQISLIIVNRCQHFLVKTKASRYECHNNTLSLILFLLLFHSSSGDNHKIIIPMKKWIRIATSSMSFQITDSPPLKILPIANMCLILATNQIETVS